MEENLTSEFGFLLLIKWKFICSEKATWEHHPVTIL